MDRRVTSPEWVTSPTETKPWHLFRSYVRKSKYDMTLSNYVLGLTITQNKI